MQLHQIRNSTIILYYAGKKFVIDPWLSDKGSDGWIGPTVELPISIEEIVSGVDAFLVTHTHEDHFSVHGMPKNIQMYVQNIQDMNKLIDFGFENVCILDEAGSNFNDIMLYKTGGLHFDKTPNTMGDVCGIILKHANEKTIYFTGDTIWCPDVEKAIETHNPDIIVVNACAARYGGGRLIMDENDVYNVYKTAPEALIVISHMEAVSHATITRNDMLNYIKKNKMISRVLIPNDGEQIQF